MREIFTGTPEEIRARETFKRLKGFQAEGKSLSRQQVRELDRARALSLRLGIRQAGIVAVGVGLAGAVGLERRRRDEQMVSINRSEVFGSDAVEVILRAANAWTKRNHCDSQVTIEPLDRVYDMDPNSVGTERSPRPGLMQIFPRQSLNGIEDGVLHEMTHACSRPAPTMLTAPIDMGGGERVMGFQGLTIITEMGGHQARNKILEEAMAERLARLIKPNYGVSDPAYREIGNLALALIPEALYPEAGTWVSRNDVPAFIRATLGLPHDVPITAQTIRETIRKFSIVWQKGLRER